MIVFDGFQACTSWIFMNLDFQQWSSCWTCLPNSFIDSRSSWNRFLIVMALSQTKARCHFPVDNLKFRPASDKSYCTWCTPQYSSGQWTAHLQTMAGGNSNVTRSAQKIVAQTSLPFGPPSTADLAPSSRHSSTFSPWNLESHVINEGHKKWSFMIMQSFNDFHNAGGREFLKNSLHNRSLSLIRV